jgi:hypothetical protein
MGWLVKNELEMMRKEAVTNILELLCRHLLGVTRKTLENINQDGQSVVWDMNQEHPEYKQGVIPLRGMSG